MAMTTTIHHATQKRAKAAGFVIGHEKDRGFVATFLDNGKVITWGENPVKVLDEAIEFIRTGQRKAVKSVDAAPAEQAAEQAPAAEVKVGRGTKKDAKPAKAEKAPKAEKPAKAKDESPAATGSIITKDYRVRYDDYSSNGDDLARALVKSCYVQVVVNAKTGRTKPQVDTDKLMSVAKENGIDVGRWADLNPGQQSMNMRNVLRAAWKRGDDVKIFGKTVAQWVGAK